MPGRLDYTKSIKKFVTIHEAEADLEALIEEARAGCEILITRAGEPCARLVAPEAPRLVPLGFLEGTVPDSVLDPLPEAELEAWERRSLP